MPVSPALTRSREWFHICVLAALSGAACGVDDGVSLGLQPQAEVVTATPPLQAPRVVRGTLDADALIVAPTLARVTIEPGPGADTVTVHSDHAIVALYDRCELTAGKELVATGADAALIVPVPLAEAEAAGVNVRGFETVTVDTGLAHRSMCHCFHGRFEGVTGAEPTCACDPGWGNDRCDTCVAPAVCFPRDRAHRAQETLLADAPESERSLDGPRIRTAEFVGPMLSADTVVVASVERLQERQVQVSATTSRTVTDVTLRVHEVVAGRDVSEVTFSMAGPSDPRAPTYASEGPSLRSGARRLYSVELRAGISHLVSGAADWDINPDDTIDLGFYRTDLATVRDALQVAKPITR